MRQSQLANLIWSPLDHTSTRNASPSPFPSAFLFLALFFWVRLLWWTARPEPGPEPGEHTAQRCGKDLLFAIICNNFREWPDVDSSVRLMNSARRRRRSWARLFLFKFFYFLTQCVDFICAAKTKASLRLWQLHFKINEVSRLSGHTFSCPGTGTDARSRVQSTGSSLARATHMLSPCPAARLFDCSLSPLSDCNLLFRFICQNIFPVPFFDTGGRDGNCRKTDESWEWERTASEHNNGCNSCNLQLHCCAYIYPREICTVFRICATFWALSTVAIPFPFTCHISINHKWTQVDRF